MKHDNDNRQRDAASFTSLAERREHVAATKDGRHRAVGACPLAVRLYKAGRAEDLRRLVDFGNVVFPDVWHQARGNLPETGGEMLFDRVMEMRPSPDELIAVAASDAAGARTQVGPFTRGELDQAVRRGIRCDSRGRIIEWKASDGRWMPVAELRRQAKGSRRKAEGERRAEAEWHLQSRSTGSFPEPLPYAASLSDGEDYWRMRHASLCMGMLAANDNRRVDILRLGVDGSKLFDKAWGNAGLGPACRVPRFMVAIGKGAEFIGGRVGSNEGAHKTPADGGNDAVENAIVGVMDQPKTDVALGDHARILDMSIRGMTAKQIAVSLGLGDRKQAEREAVALQDAALARLAEVEQRLAA